VRGGATKNKKGGPWRTSLFESLSSELNTEEQARAAVTVHLGLGDANVLVPLLLLASIPNGKRALVTSALLSAIETRSRLASS
jgi:hypothetical protein